MYIHKFEEIFKEKRERKLLLSLFFKLIGREVRIINHQMNLPVGGIKMHMQALCVLTIFIFLNQLNCGQHINQS